MNMLNALGKAAVTGNAMMRLKNDVNLNNVYQQHGQGIAAGDQAALNALAAVDPMRAYSIQQQNRNYDLRLRAEDRQQKQFDQQMKQYAASLDAAAAKAEAEKIKQGVFMASGAQTPEQWDQIAIELGQTDLVGQFEMKDALLRQYMTAAQILEAQAGPSPLVVVNTGDTAGNRPIVDKPPKGFQRVWDEKSQSYVDKPIPGGDVETERSGDAKKADLAISNYNRKAQIVDSNLDQAIKMLKENGRWVAGYGSLLSGLPESASRDFQAVLDTVKANLGFDELQSMRDASPTGGALGAISEREIAFLQAIQGNLDAAQSPEQLLSVLNEIKTRRAEFAAEREAILAKNYTASTAAELVDRVRAMPDFGSMTDEELDAWIEQNGE